MSDDQRPSDPDSTRLDPADPDATRDDGGTPQDTATAKRLGDFELLRELGRGGMGVVYEARQVSLDRRVALKVLPPALGLTIHARQRFEREARAAAKLHHTNIVPVHAVGEHDGHHFYAMDLIEGQSLDHVLHQVIDEGTNALMEATVTQTLAEIPLRPSTSSREKEETSLSDTSAGGREWIDTVAKLIAEVAEGLHYAHGRGVIHRDIKPANLMLSKEGHLCVTDFGLARVLQEPGITVTGSFLGTPAYMSPEQISAGRVKVDHRTDVYSLGVVLYEMLTLQRPFPGESREEILNGVLTKEPRSPRRINGRIPVDLETICLKALEKEPDRRYSTAAELASDLRQYLQHGLIAARRAGLLLRAVKWTRRHPTVATAIVAAVLLASVGGFSWSVNRAQRMHETVRAAVAEARRCLDDGLYRDGLDNIDVALRVAPDDPAARLVRAQLLMNAFRGGEAVAEAEAVLERNPDDWTAHLVLATLGGEFPQISVEEHLQAVERLAPGTAETHYARSLMADSASQKLDLLNAALQRDPAHAEALLGRINVYRDLQDAPTALADCERLIIARPRSGAGWRMKAHLYLDLHDLKSAMAAIERALEIDPHDAESYQVRATIHGRTGERDRELEDLRRAVELNPRRTVYLFNLSKFHATMGQREEQQALVHRTIELNPDFLGAYRHLVDTNERRSALDELSERVDGWPSDKRRAAAHETLAGGYASLHDYDKALAHAERAVLLDPTYYWTHLTRGRLRKRLGDVRGFEEDCDALASLELESLRQARLVAQVLAIECDRSKQAIEYLNRIIERAPNWSDPHCERGKLYLDRNENSKAIEDLNRAVELAPAWIDPYLLRGLAYSKEKRYEEALAEIGHAIDLEPQSFEARLRRAQVLMHLERFEEALADLDRWLQKKPHRYRNWEVLWPKALALLRLGREEEALAAADFAIESKPRFSFLIRRRAELLWYMGRIDEAFDTAERAVEHSPNDAWNYLYRARTVLNGKGDCDSVLADLTTARELAPDDPAVAHEIAWNHAAMVYQQCPDGYDGIMALDLARAAVEDQPKGDHRQIVYGMTLYRHGRLREAREALLREAELRVPRPEPWELFALAMTEWQLGNRADARNYFDRAVARMNETYPRFPEYRMLREEAAELLGIQP